MNRQTMFTIALVAILLATLAGGCKKEDNPAAAPPVTVEHPPATTVSLILVRLDGSGNPTSDATVCTVRDTSLLHGKAPVTGSLTLHAGSSYMGTFTLLDESTTPVENLNADIISEQDAHVFKFTPSDAAHIHITNQDLDSHNLIFGLNYKLTVTAGAAASGTIHVILEHHDDGNKSGTEFDLDLDRDFPFIVN